MMRYDIDQQLGTDKILDVSSIRALEGDIRANLSRRLLCIAQ